MSTVNTNIWTHQPYIYQATSSGTDVFDYDTEALVTHIPYAAGVNSVWADDTSVYMGTTNSGVYEAAVGLWTAIPYKQYPDLLSNHVLYLHGSGDYLAIATVSGVDSYNTDTNARMSTVTELAPYKCWQTSSGAHYFYENGSEETNLGGLHYSIYEWKYIKHIELSGPIPDDNYHYRITFTEGDLYTNSYQTDVRVLQGNGLAARYCYDAFNESEVTITALLDKGVTDVYIVYGNDSALVYSESPEDIYWFYEHFTGTSLDTDKWEWYYSNSSSTYTVANDYISIKPYGNTTAGIRTWDTFPERSRLEIKLRRSSSTNDMDPAYGHNGGTYIAQGSYPATDEEPHRLRRSGAEVEGNEYLSSSWLITNIYVSSTKQVSDYNGEVLTLNQSVTDEQTKIFFQAHNWGNPSFDIAFVKLMNYEDGEPTYTEHDAELITESDFYTRFHAVYTTTSGYTYTSGLDEIIQSTHINDIYVTENNSQYENENVLFLATDLGAVIIEERRGNEENCRYKYYRLDT